MAGLVADADTVVQGEYFQGRKYYEVLFSGEFTPKEPWGDTPENGIDLVARRKRYLESHLENLKELEFPILRLSHVTHDKEAQEIECENDFIFEAWPKKGKVMPGRPYGESFIKVRDVEYEKVLGSEHVLPGCYSWWGIHLQTSAEVKEAVRVLEDNYVYVVNYLKDPPESRYGNHEFHASLSDLLVCYGQSRRCHVDDIFLKVGGTLRYKYEICYVIIICTRNDDDLYPFPNIDHVDKQIFDSKDLVSLGGSVANQDAIPVFKPNYVLRSIYPGAKYFSWEGLNFAFYFPEDQDFECPHQKVEHSWIEHPDPTCAKKKGIFWKCPNLEPLKSS